jgi:phosphate transport system protein
MAVDVRRGFHHDLDLVRDDLVRLAGMVSEALARGTEALLNGDLTVAEELINGDDRLDALAVDIEERCYSLLALQQPVAVDLRALVAAARMCSEIERSGDLVVNMMKATRRLYGTSIDPKLRGLIARLATEVGRLFRLAMDAYADRNEGLAAALDDMDDAVDTLHAEYIAAIFECHDRKAIPLQAAVQMALVGRYYERIGDHAVNIGERVRYICTGWLPEHAGVARVAASGEPTRTPLTSGQRLRDVDGSTEANGSAGSADEPPPPAGS